MTSDTCFKSIWHLQYFKTVIQSMGANLPQPSYEIRFIIISFEVMERKCHPANKCQKEDLNLRHSLELKLMFLEKLVKMVSLLDLAALNIGRSVSCYFDTLGTESVLQVNGSY